MLPTLLNNFWDFDNALYLNDKREYWRGFARGNQQGWLNKHFLLWLNLCV